LKKEDEVKIHFIFLDVYGNGPASVLPGEPSGKIDPAICGSTAATATAAAEAAEATRRRCRLAKSCRGKVTNWRVQVHVIEQIVEVDAEIQVIWLSPVSAASGEATHRHGAGSTTTESAAAAAVTTAAASVAATASTITAASTVTGAITAALLISRYGLALSTKTEVLADTQIYREGSRPLTPISRKDSGRILTRDITPAG
jgi:hypothetical protein